MFNSIKSHHISSTSTIMKNLYYLFPELFTFETKSNYYDLVFMGDLRNIVCLIITNYRRELRFLGRPAELFMQNIVRILLPPELTCNIYRIIVSDLTTQKKNLMNELKLYHIIANFSVPIQLLAISMSKKLYPELWPLTKGNINHLIDLYNLMKDCNCFHCIHITNPYILLFSYIYSPNCF